MQVSPLETDDGPTMWAFLVWTFLFHNRVNAFFCTRVAADIVGLESLDDECTPLKYVYSQSQGESSLVGVIVGFR